MFMKQNAGGLEIIGYTFVKIVVYVAFIHIFSLIKTSQGFCRSEAMPPPPLTQGLISSNGSTATFLTNSADISSWAATLPAGTKVQLSLFNN